MACMQRINAISTAITTKQMTWGGGALEERSDNQRGGVCNFPGWAFGAIIHQSYCESKFRINSSLRWIFRNAKPSESGFMWTSGSNPHVWHHRSSGPDRRADPNVSVHVEDSSKASQAAACSAYPARCCELCGCGTLICTGSTHMLWILETFILPHWLVLVNYKCCL